MKVIRVVLSAITMNVFELLYLEPRKKVDGRPTESTARIGGPFVSSSLEQQVVHYLHTE